MCTRRACSLRRAYHPAAQLDEIPGSADLLALIPAVEANFVPPLPTWGGPRSNARSPKLAKGIRAWRAVCLLREGGAAIVRSPLGVDSLEVALGKYRHTYGLPDTREKEGTQEEEEEGSGEEDNAEENAEETEQDASELSLFAAAARGDISELQCLLDSGVNVNAAERSLGGVTALHSTCGSGYLACVSLLLEHGAAVDQTDDEGGGALARACAAGHDAAVLLLLNAGAVVFADEYGESPLDLTSRLGTETVQLLRATPKEWPCK